MFGGHGPGWERIEVSVKDALLSLNYSYGMEYIMGYTFLEELI